MAGMGAMMGGGMGMMGGGMGGMGGGSSVIGGGSRSLPRVGPQAPTTGVSSGKEAVDLAQRVADLKTLPRADGLEATRTVAGHRFRKVEGAWVDERYNSSVPTVRLRAFGTAYFRLLAAHPDIKAILALGDRVTWSSPSGTALVIDKQGRDDVPDEALNRLFSDSR
jgi:hypothetical protein